MQAERWQKLKSVFNEAMEVPVAERDSVLDRRCNGDAGLRSEVKKMIEAAMAETVGLERNAFERFNGDRDRALPVSIGKYRVIREIGRGGMGAVYEAVYETDDFTQRAAVKVIKRGMDTDQIVRRFRHEQKILASLVHPNITQFLDGGMTDDDLPYYAMEFVDGKPIDDLCRDRSMSLRERLQLFRQACSAVQYAHQHLIIHRDLKPKNILVTPDGTVKLLDFGIGKILDPENEYEVGTATQLGMMTPAYASPEQVQGKHIGTTSDIYSLGVVLYELLTGERPYTFSAHSQLEIERAICETEPRRPSHEPKVRAADGSGGTLPFPRQQLRGDLDNILLKCLCKEPSERYASVHEFSEDLRRFLDGLPVMARPQTFGYRAGKFIKRNRITVGAAAVVLLSLVAGITIAIWQARRAEQQRILAERRFSDVRQLANNVVFKYHDAIAELPGSTTARQMLVQDALAYLDGLGREATGDVDLQKELARAYLKMGDVQGKMYAANVGDTEGALASYHKSLALFEAVIANRPDDIEAKDDLIQVYDNLAFLMIRSGGNADAPVFVEKALDLFKQIPNDAPGSDARTLKLVDLYLRFGDTNGTGRPAVLAAHMRALPVIEGVLASGQTGYETVKASARVFQRIGTDHYWLGKQAQTAGDAEAAKGHFEQSLVFQERSLAAVEQLMAIAPERPESQRYVAAAYGNLAEALAVNGRSGDALKRAGQMLEVVEITLRSDPANRETQLNISNVYEIFANVYLIEGNDVQAINYTAKALAIDESIYRADALNQEVRGRIWGRHKLLADLYAKRGDEAQAALHRSQLSAPAK